MALDIYELIRTKQLSNLQVLCILSFLETLSGPPRVDIYGSENRRPNIAIMMTIVRAIQKIEFFESFGLYTSNEPYKKIQSFIESNIGTNLDDLSDNSNVRSNMESFILSWIETYMCETEWLVDENKETEKLYHNAHLAIPRIYATLLVRESAEFHSRISTTYRDSFQTTRSPKLDEELKLNDYTKWAPNAVLPALDEKGIVRYITPFKMKIYMEDGVLNRELVGGDIVPQPTVSSIVRSLKEIFKLNESISSKPQWYLSLARQYEGLYWDDSIDLARLDPTTSEWPKGKQVDGKLAISNINADQSTVQYNNQIFVNQFVMSSANLVESYNKILDAILKIQPDVTIELDQTKISEIAKKIIGSTFTSDLKLIQSRIDPLKGSISALKTSALYALSALVAVSGMVKLGLKGYYSPKRWTNFYQGDLKTARGAKIRQATAQGKIVKELQLNRIYTYDRFAHTMDSKVLVPLKYAYALTNILDGNFSGGIADASAVFLTGKIGKISKVKSLIDVFSKTRAGILFSGTATITAGAELLIIWGLSTAIELGLDYVFEEIFEESKRKDKRNSAMLNGYAPEAFANYNIKIPMSQFGHLIDVPVLREFLKREEILDKNGRIGTGDPIAFIDRKSESYVWTRNTVSGKTPEGLWPINFAPLESIENAKSGVKVDFDMKLGEPRQIEGRSVSSPPKDHPDLKSPPPKLKSKDDVSLFFPQYPWGITPSVCIPTFEDAAKEAVKNNILAQQDLNNIYEYNEFMNTVGKVVTTPEGLVPNISKVTAISFAESYVNTLSQPLADKLVEDTIGSLEESNRENGNGEFTQGTTSYTDSSNTILVIRPHRRISQSEEVVFGSRPSIRPNSENKKKDGKDIPIGQRTSTSDYIKKSLRTYFPDNKITRPFNNDYNSSIPPIPVKIPLPSYANGNGLRDVSSSNPLVRVLNRTERNALRSASAPGSPPNIEDYILTDVSIYPSPSGPKLDTDLFEKECQMRRRERGSKATKPDPDEDGPIGERPKGTCFPSYVKVLTPNGYIEISKMNIGDRITAFDENGYIVESVVTHKFIHDGEEISDVFEYKLSNGNKLHITDNHPVLVPSGEFLQIGWLSVGDYIIGENGEEIQLVSKEFVKKTIVYNLEVEKYHTYIAEGVRVHNLTNKWTRGPSDFDSPARNTPGFILIDSSEWENGGGQGDDDKLNNPLTVGCFPSWVSVKTLNREMKLSDISIGMEILTYNRSRGAIQSSIVTNILKHEDNKVPVFRYELSNGNTLDITKNHPVLTPNGYFTQIEKLNIGDSILSDDGTFVSILNEYHLEDCFVYNLEVENNSSYVVNGIIVSDR